MQEKISEFNLINLVSLVAGKIQRFCYSIAMRDVHAASIVFKHFAFGEAQDTGHIFRKFSYNEWGQVVKKLSFNAEGAIVMKEEYKFNEHGKVASGRFITDDDVLLEQFSYNEKGHITEYSFINPKWPRAKREVYEMDRNGRKLTKTSYDLLGWKELVTHYIYPKDSNRYEFRYVTTPDENLVLNFYYTYDKRGNYEGLYGFSIPPDEVRKLVKSESKNNAWELRSDFRIRWQYDANGNPIRRTRDQLMSDGQSLGIPLDENNRIVTQQSDSEYTEIGGKDYLTRTTEWLTRYEEPMQEVKEYIYYDNEGGQIHPPVDQ